MTLSQNAASLGFANTPACLERYRLQLLPCLRLNRHSPVLDADHTLHDAWHKLWCIINSAVRTIVRNVVRKQMSCQLALVQ